MAYARKLPARTEAECRRAVQRGKREGRAVFRIERFFRDNPDEEMTQLQLCEKFDVGEGTVRDALAHLSASGLIHRVIVYRAKR